MYTFGQIRVLAEFESSIFDEIYIVGQALKSLSIISHDYIEYVVFTFPCDMR